MALSKYYEAVTGKPNTILLPMIEKNRTCDFEQGRGWGDTAFQKCPENHPRIYGISNIAGRMLSEAEENRRGKSRFSGGGQDCPGIEIWHDSPDKLNDLKKAK